MAMAWLAAWTRWTRAAERLGRRGRKEATAVAGGTQEPQIREFRVGAPSFAAGVTTTEDADTVTGLERHELEHEEKGVDVFAEDYAWIHAPPGTVEKPVVVTSDFTERIVGVTDPEDDNSVIWGVVREGEPPKQIVEDGEYFVLKRN